MITEGEFRSGVLNPMDWQRGLPNLRDQRKLLNAIWEVQKACAEIKKGTG